jgi:hypothetical protein
MPKFILAIITVVICFAVFTQSPSKAQATVIWQVTAGQLVGAKNIDVDGTLYDVSFQDGTCADVFSGCDSATDDFAFTDSATAQLAAQALSDQVLIDGESGPFESVPSLTFGCDLDTCLIWIPYEIVTSSTSTVVSSGLFRNSGSEAVDFAGTIFKQTASADLALSSGSVFAVFTPSVAVSELSSMFSLGVGFIVFGLVLIVLVGVDGRRHKKPEPV